LKLAHKELKNLPTILQSADDMYADVAKQYKSLFIHKKSESLYHDIQPAKMLGMDCVWIDRQGLSTGGDWGATSVITERPEVVAVFADLASFAQTVVNG